MKIMLAYFSPTGNTARIAKAIGQRLTELGAELNIKDVTTLAARNEPVDLGPYDAALFGSPIHSMRSPRLFRDWLARLKGDGKRCATFFSYGGFQVHPTHFDTRERLTSRGFKVVATAEFLGAHTFNMGGWQAMADRPDDSDLSVAREYAEKIFPRLSGEDPEVVGELNPGPYTEEQLDSFEGFRFKLMTTLPTRQGRECQMCLMCEEECPSGAMDAEAGQADPAKCITCLRCVQICPDEALVINDLRPGFEMKMKNDKETPESLKAKKSRMYL